MEVRARCHWGPRLPAEGAVGRRRGARKRVMDAIALTRFMQGRGDVGKLLQSVAANARTITTWIRKTSGSRRSTPMMGLVPPLQGEGRGRVGRIIRRNTH